MVFEFRTPNTSNPTFGAKNLGTKNLLSRINVELQLKHLCDKS